MSVRKFPDFPEMGPNLSKSEQEAFDKLRIWWSQVKLLLVDLDLKTFQGSAGKEPWGITNVTISHTFDAGAATLAQTRGALGTLLQDLKQKGIIS